MHSLYVILVSVAVAVVAGYEIPYHATLDPHDKVEVTWSFTGREQDDRITFTVTAETTGWVGLGFSPNGGMPGSDIVVAWVDDNGKAFLHDMYSESESLPEIDKSEDVKLISATENAGKTIITFSRKLVTCDKSGDRDITTGTTRLIYAYGTNDPVDNIFSSMDRHSAVNRGAKSVLLLEPPSLAKKLPDDVKEFDVTLKEYEVPESETTYFCQFHPTPKLDRKHHIVAVAPLLQPGNEAIVHHATVYACWNVTMEHVRNENKTGGICFTDEMPEFLNSCRKIVHAWAVGGSTYYFPEEGGFGLGAHDSPQFFMLEMHYDNPQNMKGMVDSSGLRIYYTPTLRKYDVDNMVAGTIMGIFVPPRTPEFTVTGFCHGSCSQEWIPPSGITLISYLLHAHLLGTTIQLDLYRQGKPVGVIAREDNYDFNYQENRLFIEPVKIMPGDTLKVTCTMNSMANDTVVVGGIGTREEMCAALLGYYPKQAIAECMSEPTYLYKPDHALYSTFDTEAKYTGTPDYNNQVNVNLNESLRVVPWDSQKASVAQEIAYTSPQRILCHVNNVVEHASHKSEFDISKYAVLLESKQPQCSADEVDLAASFSASGAPSVIASGVAVHVALLSFMSSLLR